MDSLRDSNAGTFTRVGRELLPTLLRLPPNLRHPARRHSVLPRHIAGPLPHAQVLGHTPIATGQRRQPRTEVEPERRQIGG